MIYHTDLFAPLIAAVEKVVGIEYWGRESNEPRTGVTIRGGKGGSDVVPNAVDPASFRVLADHARAVAFLLADGVFPSNEGRGYVLRRILRRAVRHAWLLGRKEPTLVAVVAAVIETMGDVYPELRQRAQHILNTTRVEEQGFLATIEGGLARFEQLAPTLTARRRYRDPRHDQRRRRVPPLRHVRLPDRPHRADGARARLSSSTSRASRRRSTRSASSRRTSASRAGSASSADVLDDVREWETPPEDSSGDSSFVGYDSIEIETQVTAVQAFRRRPRRDHAARVAVLRGVGRTDLRPRRDRRRRAGASTSTT